MGKLKVLKTGPLATIQDKGRYGFRKYGIPQSGAMDIKSMVGANRLVGNEEGSPVLEFALTGMKLEALEKTIVGVAGASLKVNCVDISQKNVELEGGDLLETTFPDRVYGYLSLGGKLAAQNDFNSYSTYLMAGFGGYKGRNLMAGDILETVGDGQLIPLDIQDRRAGCEVAFIRIMKGPEWHALEETLEGKNFQIDSSSNRMGIRLKRPALISGITEIASSAVVPGIIQLPSNGLPIVLMRDCQTMGGYPRIGKVLDEDLGKLAQVRPTDEVRFVMA